MKRQNAISKGVYNYSNGMIGTSDLPEFVAELAYRKRKESNKQAYMLRNIHAPHVMRKLDFRGLIAKAWAGRVH